MRLKDGKSTISTKFMASCENYEDASIVIVGVPMDFTCSFKAGTRFGPQKIREVSDALEEFSVYINKDLADYNFFDYGDIKLNEGNVEDSLRIIGEVAEAIISDGKFPLFIGGEHLISVPIIKKMYDKYKDELLVLHFDAHADLREEYLGLSNSHASTIRRITDFLPGKNIYQYGIRSGTKEEFDYARENTNMFTFSVIQPLKETISRLGTKPIYVTLDIDVVDPAYANGTGTPEPGGISSEEIIRVVHLLEGLNIVGLDIVEVSPQYDSSDRTALLAAKIIRELILTIGDKLPKK